VQIILQHDREYAPLPMWGWMWRIWDTLYDVCGIHWHEYANA
jgi:hypothetical protein